MADIFKMVVARVRNWGKSPIGSTYTRYFESAEDMAKAAKGYAKYYGPDVMQALGWSSLTALNMGLMSINASKDMLKKQGPLGAISAAVGASLSGGLAASSIARIAEKSKKLAEFKSKTGIKSMSEVYGKVRKSKEPIVEGSFKEIEHKYNLNNAVE